MNKIKCSLSNYSWTGQMKSAAKTALTNTFVSGDAWPGKRREETLQNQFKYCPSLLLLFYRYIFINYI